MKQILQSLNRLCLLLLLLLIVLLAPSCSAQTNPVVPINYAFTGSNNAVVTPIYFLVTDTNAISFIKRAQIWNWRTQLAIQNLCVGLKTNNLWTNWVAFYPFVGGNSNSCAQNLVSTNYTIAWCGTNNTPFTNSAQYDPSNIVFTSRGIADTLNGNFIGGGPSMAWGNTGYSPSAWAATNSFTLYAFTDSSITNQQVGIPGGFLGNDATSCMLFGVDPNLNVPTPGGQIFNTGTISVTNAGGNLMVTRIGLSLLNIRNDYGINQSSNPGPPLNSTNGNNICILRVPNTGGGTIGQIRTAAFGGVVSGTVTTNFFNVMTAFQQSLNRNNP